MQQPLTIHRLIDRARQAAEIPSDYALAKMLNVRRGSVSHWRQEINLPREEAAYHLAEIAALSPTYVLVLLQAWKLKRENRFRMARVFEELAEEIKEAGIEIAIEEISKDGL